MRTTSNVWSQQWPGAPSGAPLASLPASPHGRRARWMLLSSTIEKSALALALLLVVLADSRELLVATVVAETVFGLMVLVAVRKGKRLRSLLKAIAVMILRTTMSLQNSWWKNDS